MFAPFFRKFAFHELRVFKNFVSLVLSVDRLNILHEAGSVSSSFWLILAGERKIIRLGE